MSKITCEKISREEFILRGYSHIEAWKHAKDVKELEAVNLLICNSTAASNIQSYLYTTRLNEKSSCKYVLKQMQRMLVKAKGLKWDYDKLCKIIEVRHKFAHTNFRESTNLANSIRDCKDLIMYFIVHALDDLPNDIQEIVIQINKKHVTKNVNDNIT